MTATSNRSLAFFDPQNIYQSYDVTSDPRVFIRFIQYELCLEHVVNHTTVLQQKLHLFFSSLNHHLLSDPIFASEDAIKYIVCRDETAREQIQSLADRRSDRNIILEDDLEFEIGHIQTKLLYSMMKKMPDESVERDQCGKAIKNTLEEMIRMVGRNMSISSGVAPVEIDRELEMTQSIH